MRLQLVQLQVKYCTIKGIPAARMRELRIGDSFDAPKHFDMLAVHTALRRHLALGEHERLDMQEARRTRRSIYYSAYCERILDRPFEVRRAL